MVSVFGSLKPNKGLKSLASGYHNARLWLRLSGFRVLGLRLRYLSGVQLLTNNLGDQMTLKSRGPMPLYYESPYGYMNLKPF